MAFAELIEMGAEWVVIVVDKLAKVDEYFGVEEYGEPFTNAALKRAIFNFCVIKQRSVQFLPDNLRNILQP